MQLYGHELKKTQASAKRNRQLKPSNDRSHSDVQDKLEWAFEEGYKLGRDDAKQGIFIDLDTIVDQFRFTMTADIDTH